MYGPQFYNDKDANDDCAERQSTEFTNDQGNCLKTI